MRTQKWHKGESFSVKRTVCHLQSSLNTKIIWKIRNMWSVPTFIPLPLFVFLLPSSCHSSVYWCQLSRSWWRPRCPGDGWRWQDWCRCPSLWLRRDRGGAMWPRLAACVFVRHGIWLVGWPLRWTPNSFPLRMWCRRFFSSDGLRLIRLSVASSPTHGQIKSISGGLLLTNIKVMLEMTS